jgi:hypothetical protein
MLPNLLQPRLRRGASTGFSLRDSPEFDKPRPGHSFHLFGNLAQIAAVFFPFNALPPANAHIALDKSSNVTTAGWWLLAKRARNRRIWRCAVKKKELRRIAIDFNTQLQKN